MTKSPVTPFAAENLDLDSIPARIHGKSIRIAQLRIYGLCLTLSIALFSLASTLNFWHGAFVFPSSEIVAGGNILLAYVWLTFGLVAPLFFSLQVTLEQRVTRKSVRETCLSFQPIFQSLFFSSTLFYILPLVAALNLSLGLLSFHADVIRFFIAISAIVGMWPAVPIFVLAFFKTIGSGKTFSDIGAKDFIFQEQFLNAPLCPILYTFLSNLPSNRASLKGIRTKDLIFQIQYLNAKDFSLDLLESKPDQDIDRLIEVARFSRKFDNAEQLSSYLLNRHLNLSVENIER
jgi:hypothetical protein